MSKKITALYERSATPDPERIRRQQNDLEAFARFNGFRNFRHFVDDGRSANDAKRPALGALMTAIKAGEIETVIVTDVARLTRDMIAFDRFVTMMEEQGIRLIAILEKLDIMPEHIHDAATGLNYTLCGDYYLPDLGLTEDDRYTCGKYGSMRMEYLKNHRPVLFNRLLLSGQLMKHLREIDETCNARLLLVIPKMAEAEGITEQLKETDQMRWVGLMNNIRACAEEMLLDELIFS